MASVDEVVALARPVLYCSGTGGVAGTVLCPPEVALDCFLEPPKDQDRPDLRKPEFGRGVGCM